MEDDGKNPFADLRFAIQMLEEAQTRIGSVRMPMKYNRRRLNLMLNIVASIEEGDRLLTDWAEEPYP